MQLSNAKLKLNYVPVLLLAGIITFVVHEFFHWLAGTALGYSMTITPNQVRSNGPMLAWHALIVSAAGPIITYVQAFIGYRQVTKHASLAGFAFLYMAFFTRLLAMAMSVFNPNDEARISRDLGIGMWTLPAIVVAILFALVFVASKRLKLTVRDQVVCYVVASVVVTGFVGADYLFFRKT